MKNDSEPDFSKTPFWVIYTQNSHIHTNEFTKFSSGVRLAELISISVLIRKVLSMDISSFPSVEIAT